MNAWWHRTGSIGCTLTVAFLLLALVGCSPSKPIDSKTQVGDGASKGAPKTVEQQSVQEPGLSEKSESAPKDIDGGAVMEEELQGITGLGGAAKEALKKFGVPDEKTPAEIWGADGWEHQSWIYKKQDLELGLVTGDDQKQVVVSILIQGKSTIKTLRNIGVGSSKEDVLKAYGKEINQESSSEQPDQILVGTLYGGVIFNMENNKVTSIYIGAAAE